MTNHCVCSKSSITGATCGSPEITPVIVELLFLDLKFYVHVLWIVVCPFILFLLVIVLFVRIRLTASDTMQDIISHAS